MISRLADIEISKNKDGKHLSLRIREREKQLKKLESLESKLIQ